MEYGSFTRYLMAAIGVMATAQANALEVAAGCAAPTPAPDGHEFYVDPAIGRQTNDGSIDHPWRTLEEVLDPSKHMVSTQARVRDVAGGFTLLEANPGGRIKPGDVVYLRSGNHGSPVVAQLVNSEFISVMAAPGEAPVVNSLSILGSSHWLFRGIKFQGVRPEGENAKPLAGVFSHDRLGPSDNVVFVDDSFSTEDRSDRWTPLDWVRRPYATGLRSEARCTTIEDNHFFNLRDAISIAGDDSLIQNNLIEDTGNDGIDMMASNIVIRGNRIWRGRHTPAELLHPDGIQGWTLPGATNRNVVVDANSIINLNPADDNMRQGISIFDGRWDGLVVSNNVVITNHWHGIALYGVTDAIVVNNTVIPARADKPTWITIHDAKDATPSRHVIVRNNIAAQFVIGGSDIVFDHNIAEKAISLRAASGVVDRIVRGVVGDQNRIDPHIFQAFVEFDPKGGKFDLRPEPASAATKAGADENAPSSDIQGRRRISPVDIGAYAR